VEGAVGGVAATLRLPARARVQAEAADARWDLLLICVSVYILTAVGRVHELFPAIAAFRPAVLSGFLATALYVLNQDEPRRSLHLFQTTTKLLLVFLFWMFLSVSGALVITPSFDLFNGFAKTVLMFLVMVGAVRGFRDVERLAVVYLAAATLYAWVVVTRFDLGAGDAWRLGHLYYYDANDFAVLALTAMPFGLYFLHRRREGVPRVVAAAALAVLTLAFVHSGSRGGFIALLAMAGFVLLRYSAIPLQRRVGATVLVAVIVAFSASSQYWAQMSTIVSDDDYNHTSETGRTQIWRRGVGYILRHPILGVGPDNFPIAEGTISPLAERQQYGIGVRWNAPHNTLLQVGAEMGVPGLALFTAIFIVAFRSLRTSRRRDAMATAGEGAHEMTQVLRAALIGFIVGAFFLSLAYAEMLYTLIALAVGLQKVSAWR
jgi:O-antigen ligase